MQSRSVAPPAADYGIFNRLDGYAPLRNMLRQVAARDEQWAGIPMPIDGFRLVIEPKFANGEFLSTAGVTQKMLDDEADRLARVKAKFGDFQFRSMFWSMFRKCWVVTFTDPDGKVRHGLHHDTHPVSRMLSTLYTSDAWGIEQEHRAVQLLGTLLRHHLFKAYLLTGMFIETSKRTGLTYLFRRLRPTLVLDTRTDPTNVSVRCALCAHPIGYYEDTWSGAMTPTDDVIAHLTMMRADEPLLWRRSNQHPSWSPLAGIF